MATMVAQKLSHLLPSLRQAHQEPQPSVQPEPVFTVDRAKVPPIYWKPYIYVGYRPLHQTWRFYFRTLFQQHNEAVNVWTHLLAALLLLLRLAIFVGTVDFWGDPHALPLFIIVLASFTYLFLSALAHLLQAKSEFWHYSFFFLDYVGVAVYQFGSALAHFYYAIEPAWHAQVQTIFLPMAAFLAWLSCTGSCYNKYIQKPGLLGRTCQEVPSALAYALDISPVAHRILVSPNPATDDLALLYHKCQVIFFLLAAAFFSALMPERWFPGSCHLFGQGHQLFHVFLVFCTLAQLEAVALDYEARRPIYEPLHTRWPHNFSGLFLLTVVSSVLTAFLLSQLTHLIKSSTKMLTLLPGERKAPQRTPPAGVRQTSIASFFTLQSGKKNGDQRSVSSHIESQTNRESKKDATQLDHLIQGLGDDCVAPPLATSTPTDIQEAGLSTQSLQASGHHRLGTPFLTVLSLFQPETNLVCAGDSQDSLACSFTQDLESSCLLDQKEGEKDSSWKREWLHGSKKRNHQGVERHSKPPGDKGQQPLDKPKLEKLSAKENRQAPVLFQTYRESWSGENTEVVKQRSCPVPVVSWESEKNDRDSWSQLFTEDSQGQRVIAHNSRVPFQEVTNNWNQDLGQFPNSTWAQCQDRLTQLNLQPDLLFTQDSEGNQVIRHQV